MRAQPFGESHRNTALVEDVQRIALLDLQIAAALATWHLHNWGLAPSRREACCHPSRPGLRDPQLTCSSLGARDYQDRFIPGILRRDVDDPTRYSASPSAGW
jgi:hypothetical protein